MVELFDGTAFFELDLLEELLGDMPGGGREVADLLEEARPGGVGNFFEEEDDEGALGGGGFGGGGLEGAEGNFRGGGGFGCDFLSLVDL